MSQNWCFPTRMPTTLSRSERPTSVNFSHFYLWLLTPSSLVHWKSAIQLRNNSRERGTTAEISHVVGLEGRQTTRRERQRANKWGRDYSDFSVSWERQTFAEMEIWNLLNCLFVPVHMHKMKNKKFSFHRWSKSLHLNDNRQCVEAATEGEQRDCVRSSSEWDQQKNSCRKWKAYEKFFVSNIQMLKYFTHSNN